MHLVILTGASRGLGRALALQLAQVDVALLTIARRPDAALAAEVAARGARIEQWALDLAHDIGVAARLEAWLHQQDPRRFGGATLINNAGLIGGVGPLERMDSAALAAVLRVNLEAPMALTGAFLRATAAWPGQRKVLNISSGAGRNPIAGWAAYCASKAGLDHFSRVSALDEARKSNGAKVVALAPGVIDTAMQAELRGAAADGFPDQQRFVDLHAKAQLASPRAAAQKIAAFLARPDFGANPVADVRDA
jgi:benzil reductase ((S)-benzoin forming)